MIGVVCRTLFAAVKASNNRKSTFQWKNQFGFWCYRCHCWKPDLVYRSWLPDVWAWSQFCRAGPHMILGVSGMWGRRNVHGCCKCVFLPGVTLSGEFGSTWSSHPTGSRTTVRQTDCWGQKKSSPGGSGEGCRVLMERQTRKSNWAWETENSNVRFQLQKMG